MKEILIFIIPFLFPLLPQAEKKAKEQQEKQADLDYNAQKELIALHKEHEFQKYAKQVIESVSTTTHHLYPLLKASKEITGLGGGPFSRGSEGTNPGFQAQDVAETQLPCCSSTTAEEVKTKKEHWDYPARKASSSFYVVKQTKTSWTLNSVKTINGSTLNICYESVHLRK